MGQPEWRRLTQVLMQTIPLKGFLTVFLEYFSNLDAIET